MNCEICGKPYHHKHHIISKSFGGKNGKENIAFLCASCHV
jgi:5-methylcytosine-specific restriction endonuclease McrA